MRISQSLHRIPTQRPEQEVVDLANYGGCLADRSPALRGKANKDTARIVRITSPFNETFRRQFVRLCHNKSKSDVQRLGNLARGECAVLAAGKVHEHRVLWRGHSHPTRQPFADALENDRKLHHAVDHTPEIFVLAANQELAPGNSGWWPRGVLR